MRTGGGGGGGGRGLTVLDLGGAAELVALHLDLASKLTRRGNDRDDGTIARAQVRLRIDMHDAGQQESERFPGARARDADHIAPAERQRPALRLDGRRLREAGLAHLLEHILGE